MTTRLRELAERWKAPTVGTDWPACHARAIRHICATELLAILAILDAEGDGGAVAYQCRTPTGQWHECTFDEHERVSHNRPKDARKLYTSPARSGGVSDADVSNVAKMIADQVGNGMREKYEVLAKQILTHFAKGTEVGGDTPELFAGTADQLNALSVRLPAEDSQWCNTHGIIHSVELADGDCTFPNIGEKP